MIDHLRTIAPGASAPHRARGHWRLEATPGQLLDAMRGLLQDSGAELYLVAGEDRPGSGEMRVHYLLGVPGPPASPRWSLVDVEVALDRAAPRLPTLAALSFPASRFERELRDLFGIEPADHPDPRPLVRHGFWPADFHPLRADAAAPAFEDDGRPFPFTEVAGEGVYEIPVGPVHAGVIEPGHFRFSVLGETILKMRARLYFTHKGTEKLFEGKTIGDGVALAERISGDTSVGHAVAYCQAIEALSDVEIPARAAALRTMLLELERIYNHIADVGALAADTGFAIGQSHCLRMRETVLRLNARLAGHRLLRGGVVPGGVTLDENAVRRADLMGTLLPVLADFDEIVAICLDNTLVQDRLETTGRLATEVAKDFGVVGYVARACGIDRDVRRDLPFAAYDRLPVSPVVESTGDVLARFQVRVRDVRASVTLIEQALAIDPGGAQRTDLPTPAQDAVGFGVVEGWRGRIAHMAIAGAGGRLARVKVVDPSFFNWPALARALEDNIVPDFPLCNKSFNQSYSGNDL